MSEKIEDGGPAFPVQSSTWDYKGLTARDWFASQALAGIGTWMPVPSHGTPSLHSVETLKARAEYAYKQADAMLEARKGGA